MQSHPDSQLYKNWDYYIQPSKDDSAGNEDILNIQAPEDLTVCDPACGSGHMLTYAFDLLYEIYEEEGYAPSDIPGLILKHNLYGMEIDERAASLAAFALTMKARSRSRRFFKKKIIICCHNARSFYATSKSDDGLMCGIAMNIITTHNIFSSLMDIEIVRQHPDKTI